MQMICNFTTSLTSLIIKIAYAQLNLTFVDANTLKISHLPLREMKSHERTSVEVNFCLDILLKE